MKIVYAVEYQEELKKMQDVMKKLQELCKFFEWNRVPVSLNISYGVAGEVTRVKALHDSKINEVEIVKPDEFKGILFESNKINLTLKDGTKINISIG